MQRRGESIRIEGRFGRRETKVNIGQSAGVVITIDESSTHNEAS